MSFEKYVNHLQKVADVQYASALLNWDQEVMMPVKGTQGRSRQLATLSVIAHEWTIDPDFGKLLEGLVQDSSLSWEQKRNVELTLRDFEKQNKYSSDFVQKMSETQSKAFNAWIAARKKNDFAVFAPVLEELVALKREEAKFLGYKEHPYDALMDEYEPGATVAMVDELFEGVRVSLQQLLDRVNASPVITNKTVGKKYDAQKQFDVTIEFLKKMGYDFDAGRQDISEHPFTINFNSRDVRVTTRANEDDIFEMLSSSIHEGGHALYEQGLLYENYGLPSGTHASLGIHESQSRLWENNVGRSKAFWEDNFQLLTHAFPQQFKGFSARDFYVSNNLIQPSLIRVQADELTYHFHIMIRYELEKQLIDGSLEVKELKAAWNDLYRKYLGIDVPSDNQGVLQDIHWSHGSFGYFATYSLGSFYATQFFHQAKQEIEDLEGNIAKGNLHVLKDWLNDRIHKYGRLYKAEDLCEKVTGEKLDFKYFRNYIEEKLSDIYSW